MTTEDAKEYLSRLEIPRLFESLMTGLMYHRPSDHIRYLMDCLEKCQGKEPSSLSWSAFVDIRRSKTPLPPINDKRRPGSKEGSRPSSKTRAKGDEILSVDMGNLEDSLVSRVMSPASNASARGAQSVTPRASNRTVTPDIQGRPLRGSYKEEPTPRDNKSSPLPAIPTSTTTTTTSAEKFDLPDIPIALLLGAPGCGKEAMVGNLLKRYPGWEHLNMGALIREEIQNKGDAQTKWKLTKDLMSRGEPATEEVTVEVLMAGLKRCSSAKGVVITGFPRSMEQVTDYDTNIGRADVAFMIDCDEQIATDRLLRKGKNSNRPEDSMSAVANKLNYFKAHTLAAAKHLDDQGKLVVIDGNTEENSVAYEVGKAFDKLFLSKYGKEPVGEAPRPDTSASSVPDASTYKGKYEKEDSDIKDDDGPMYTGAIPQPPALAEADTGRKPDLPQCPIIFVAGGPGSGKGTQCARIVQRYPGLVHLSMGDIIRTEISTKGTADDVWGMVATLVSKGEMAPEEVTIDLLKEQLVKHKDAKGFLIEGFPRDAKQMEAFNKTIGGLNFVMLFDCEEYYMKTRLVKRGKESGRVDDNLTAIGNRIKFYKYNTIPLMKTLDDQKKLVAVDADRDMDTLCFDISQLMDFAFFGKQEDKKEDKAEEDKTEDKKEEDKTKDQTQPAESSKDREAEAATKIQAGFRGFLVRSQKQDEKETKEETKAEEAKPSTESVPVQDEVVEPTITAEGASTTGDNIANPSHTKTLDETADS